MKSISFYTFGCRLNQSETNVVERTFEKDGYKIVDIHEPADIVVINTCTVTENGDNDTRRLVNKINRINPKARIALIGCQAQVQKEKLAELSNVHWIVGNAKKMDLKTIVEETEKSERSQKSLPANRIAKIITPTISKNSFTIPVAGIDSKHKRANLKIQDGCDFFCSFCEIPYARGRARSREFEDILKEAKELAGAGHKEIILTGINIGTYQYKNYELMDVINALEQINGLHRIRISSIEPTTIPWDLIEKMSKDSKLCRYLHIPLQSGSDKILKLMKRKYTADEFRNFIHKARETVKEICIGTDVIVGFPGENEEEFQTTEERLREWSIDYFHIFSYSERQMAKSQHLSDPVPSTKIAQRSEILRQLSQRKRLVYYQSLLGTEQNVLFEIKKNNFWIGKTDHFANVQCVSEQNLLNTLKCVKIESVSHDFLTGTLMHA